MTEIFRERRKCLIVCGILTVLTLKILWGAKCVDSYTDLRDTPCLDEEAEEKLPKNHVIWDGRINLEMECDNRYDLPLNAPPFGRFTCEPDGSPWQPDYMPDCNVEMIPSDLILYIAGLISRACCTNRLTGGRPIVSFDLISECKRFGLGNCRDVNASLHCQGRGLSQELIKEPRLHVKSHVFVELKFSYSRVTPWQKYISVAKHLAFQVLKDVYSEGLATSAFHRLLADCDKTTVGVLRAGMDVSCRGCSLGHYLDKSQKECLPCEPGFYADTPLSTKCKLCPSLALVDKLSEWAAVKAVAPTRQHIISSCPTLVKLKNGTLQVKLQKTQNYHQTEKHSLPEPGSRASHQSFSVCGIVLAIEAFLFAYPPSF